MSKLISFFCVLSVFIIMFFGFIITANAEDNTNPTENNEEITEPAEKTAFITKTTVFFIILKTRNNTDSLK